MGFQNVPYRRPTRTAGMPQSCVQGLKCGGFSSVQVFLDPASAENALDKDISHGLYIPFLRFFP